MRRKFTGPFAAVRDNGRARGCAWGGGTLTERLSLSQFGEMLPPRAPGRDSFRQAPESGSGRILRMFDATGGGNVKDR